MDEDVWDEEGQGDELCRETRARQQAFHQVRVHPMHGALSHGALAKHGDNVHHPASGFIRQDTVRQLKMESQRPCRLVLT